MRPFRPAAARALGSRQRRLAERGAVARTLGYRRALARVAGRRPRALEQRRQADDYHELPVGSPTVARRQECRQPVLAAGRWWVSASIAPANGDARAEGDEADPRSTAACAAQGRGVRMTATDPFARGGLARLSDLDTPTWRDLFTVLEAREASFLARDAEFRSPQYRWPRHALHSWSRVWEYPYVLRFLRDFRSSFAEARLPRVADLGSGVTFFPFAAADIGFDVVCLDTDPVCVRDLQAAICVVPKTAGHVEARLSDSRLPLSDGEMDVVYSVSVIEHVPEFESLVREVCRVLRPGGWFIATVDIALAPGYELSANRHADLVRELSHGFRPLVGDVAVHPLDVLDPTRSPFPLAPPRGLSLAWFHVKQRILKPLLGRAPTRHPVPRLAVQAFALERVGP